MDDEEPKEEPERLEAPQKALERIGPTCECFPPDPMLNERQKLSCARCGALYGPPGASPHSGTAPPVDTRWKPGESGNPKGRTAGATLAEWLNHMADYTLAELNRVMNDDQATASKKAAARTWIDATSQAKSKVGLPIAGDEFDRISDRTEGKAVDRSEAKVGIGIMLTHTAPPPPPPDPTKKGTPPDAEPDHA